MKSSTLSGITARAAVVTMTAGAVLMAAAGTASAHVSAEPAEIVRGGYDRVTFYVPNESQTAAISKLELIMPTDTPLTFVQAEPRPGWTAQVVTGALDEPVEVNNTTVTQAVRTVTWTAQPGQAAPPDQFLTFSILLTALPDNTDQLVVPAIQYYDDGEVARWEQPPADGDEPEYPAPVIRLADANNETPGQGVTAETDAADAATQAGPDDTARWLGGAALLLAALAVGVGFGALLRSRRTSAAPNATEDSTS